MALRDRREREREVARKLHTDIPQSLLLVTPHIMQDLVKCIQKFRA